MPESGSGSRYFDSAFAAALLRSLPPAHQGYVFEEIRKLCRDHLRSRRVRASELTPEELLSEIWLKLFGAVSGNDASQSLPVASAKWGIDLHAPERDGRVLWLIEGIRGWAALAHRQEDIFRERHGRRRRIVQTAPGDRPSDIPIEPKEGGALKERDDRRAWRGALIVARQEFQPSDDLLMLLQVMANDPDIVDAWTGEQWPIRTIVSSLNVHFSPPPWTDRRTDNARRRLVNWIDRLMTRNGLDAVDLEAVFARVARQHEREE